jgi:phospholipid/cholesterol/gamma-HCH transport system substrate-binding protein
MSDRSRNIIVGLTFIVALALCMYGIVLLGKLPAFGVHQYRITLTVPDASGVSSGSRVDFMGVDVGQVKSAYLNTDPNDVLTVKIELLISPDTKIPTSAVAVIVRPSTGVGSTYVNISAPQSSGPFLPTDGSATMKAVASDSGLIPKDVVDSFQKLSLQLGTVANDLHVLLDYTPPEAVENANPNDAARPRPNASTVIVRLDRTLKSIQELLSDPKLQGNIRDVVQNLADASARLKGTIEKVDTVVGSANGVLTGFSNATIAITGAATKASSTLDTAQKDIDRVAQQLVETLATMDKAVKLLSEGNGTAGLLLKDDRLYNGLLDLSNSLKSTVNDLDFLLNKWKDQGIDLHLK